MKLLINTAAFVKRMHPEAIRITPEHRTSMLCSCCHTKMAHVVHGIAWRRNGQPHRVRSRPDGALVRREIHGLYQCSHCYTRWNRDKNAAVNIRDVFLAIAATRLPPLRFRRSFKLE